MTQNSFGGERLGPVPLRTEPGYVSPDVERAEIRWRNARSSGKVSFLGLGNKATTQRINFARKRNIGPVVEYVVRWSSQVPIVAYWRTATLN